MCFIQVHLQPSIISFKVLFSISQFYPLLISDISGGGTNRYSCFGWRHFCYPLNKFWLRLEESFDNQQHVEIKRIQVIFR